MVIMHVWYYGLKGHSGEIADKMCARPLFLLFKFFCSVGTLLFGGVVGFFWHLWIGRAGHPGPFSGSLAVEVWSLRLTLLLLLSTG